MRSASRHSKCTASARKQGDIQREREREKAKPLRPILEIGWGWAMLYIFMYMKPPSLYLSTTVPSISMCRSLVYRYIYVYRLCSHGSLYHSLAPYPIYPSESPSFTIHCTIVLKSKREREREPLPYMQFCVCCCFIARLACACASPSPSPYSYITCIYIYIYSYSSFFLSPPQFLFVFLWASYDTHTKK